MNSLILAAPILLTMLVADLAPEGTNALKAASLPAAIVAPPFGVRDTAKIFSADAVAGADAVLADIYRENRWPAVVETVSSLGGRSLRNVAAEKMKAANIHGFFMLICRENRRSCLMVNHEWANRIDKARIANLEDSLDDNLRAHQNTKALMGLVNKMKIATFLDEARSQLAAPQPGTNDGAVFSHAFAGRSPKQLNDEPTKLSLSPQTAMLWAGNFARGRLSLLLGIAFGIVSFIRFVPQAVRARVSLEKGGL